MDPLSQGIVGAMVPQVSLKKTKYLLYAAIIGFLAGMSPDLDILIRSSHDSLLFLEFHRQFTHSLIFIPIGALLGASLFHLVYFRNKLPFLTNYKFAVLGYATHGLLDSCTTYGTQLFWPFSNYRVAWNNVSIMDPLFTLPLVFLVILGIVKKNTRWPRVALAYGMCYLLLGVYQNHRAEAVGYQLAHQRGHTPVRLEAKPSFGNLVLWKVIYEAENKFYVDAVRVLGQPQIFEGESIDKLVVERDFPWLDPQSMQANDIKRFTWFSKGYVALDPQQKNRVIDVRYSFLPNQIKALWGIELNPQNQNQHAVYEDTRKISPETKELFWSMLTGQPISSSP